jgi:hypothetical protein
MVMKLSFFARTELS